MPSTDEKKAMNPVAKAIKPPKNSHQFFNPNLKKHREIVARAKPSSPIANVDCVEEIIDLGSGVKLLSRRFTPKGSTQEAYPTIFFIDGTAWVADGGEFSRWISSHLCNESGYQVVELHTLLAPEDSILKCKQYAYRFVKYFYDQSLKYHVDRNKMLLVGYSSGGNIADYIDTRFSREGINFIKKILVSPFV